MVLLRAVLQESVAGVCALGLAVWVACVEEKKQLVSFVMVQTLVTGCVVVPTVVVLLNGRFFRSHGPLSQLCAVHFCWNAHLIGHASMAVPFVLQEWSRKTSNSEALYDYFVFMFFVCAPLELSTGIVKRWTSKTKNVFDWRHRAGLGICLCHLTFFFVSATYYVRPKSFVLTACATFGFYGYAGATYLPNQPQGQPPEITGSREWPWLKEWLRPYLWAPIAKYMQIKVLFDDDRQQSLTTLESTTKTLSSLKEAERLAAKAVEELAPFIIGGHVPRAHPIRQLETKLQAALNDLRRIQRTTQEKNNEDDYGTRNGDGDDDDKKEFISKRHNNCGLEEGEAVIVGYHPHGIIPFNSAIMTTLFDFKLGTRCVVATDAFIHAVAWMRDLGQWLGVRECTREAIARALAADISVVLVPGGQAEIFTTKSWGQNVSVYRGHKGFVRLALKTRKRLLPVFAFGEWELMDNVYLPTLQAWSRTHFGFPFPFLPYGRFGLPLPRRPPKGVTIVVGRPLDVESFLDPTLPTDEAIEDAVDKAHEAYFLSLQDLFHKFKAQAGYPDHCLHFHDAPKKKKHLFKSSLSATGTMSPDKMAASSWPRKKKLNIATQQAAENNIQQKTPTTGQRNVVTFSSHLSSSSSSSSQSRTSS